MKTILSLSLFLAAALPVARAQTTVNWLGDPSGSPGDGSWGDAANWSPSTVPNNGNGNTYNVTITRNPAAEGFNGPGLDLDVTVDNLTLVDRALVNGGIRGGPGNPGYSLTVLGTTRLLVATAGQDTGILQASNAVFTLGTLANYDAATHTLTGGGLAAFSDSGGPGTVRFRGADIVTNNGFIVLNGVNASLRNQDNGADALARLAVNNGSLQLSGGHALSTAGGLINTNFILVESPDAGAPSVLRVNGTLTNHGTISVDPGGRLIVTGSAANSGTLTLGPGAGAQVGGTLTQSGGQVNLGTGGSTFDNPQLVADRIVLAQGTTLLGTGFISASNGTTVGGVFAPGNSPGTIGVNGQLTLEHTTELQLQLAGFQPGDGYDQILQRGGTVLLSGTLTLSFLDGFENSVGATDVFDVLHSDDLLTGAFENVASGGRLLTADGLGSFVVTYDGTDVFLSGFQAVPEPGTWALLGLGGAGAGVVVLRRRRTSAGR